MEHDVLLIINNLLKEKSNFKHGLPSLILAKLVLYLGDDIMLNLVTTINHNFEK